VFCQKHPWPKIDWAGWAEAQAHLGLMLFLIFWGGSDPAFMGWAGPSDPAQSRVQTSGLTGYYCRHA